MSNIGYPGRLLLNIEWPFTDYRYATSDHMAQLTSGSPDPTDMTGSPPAGGYINAVSPDGSRVAFDSNDTAYQASDTLTVLGPDGKEEYPGGFKDASMVFSPDGKRLAYNQGNFLMVSDPATKRFPTVLEPGCKTYSSGPNPAEPVCGGVEGPVWLDPTTLFVSYFAGEMPDTVVCSKNERCYVPPNTYSIITTDGKIVKSVEPSAADAPFSARGNTIVLRGFTTETWIDIDQLRAGTASPKPLPTSALWHSLSPDGTKIVVRGDKWWQLVDLRTGAVQQLGTPVPNAWDFVQPASDNDAPVFWSPDGKFFALQGESSAGQVNIFVVPASSASGGAVATLSGTDEASLIGWAI